MARPNILLLMPDQMRYDCLGSVNRATSTPALDRLAREGCFTHMIGKSHLSPCHDPCSLESAPSRPVTTEWFRVS
ncbi:MAG: hypothetical protein FJ224_03100 [Lentisphaerae bacterium]|nr:hypothetical protein [Lentisphaerota bacterium]